VRKIVVADLPRGSSEACATSMLVTGDANEFAINALVGDVGLSDATRQRFARPANDSSPLPNWGCPGHLRQGYFLSSRVITTQGDIK